MMRGDWDSHDWGWGSWVGMSLMMTALAVLTLLTVVLLVRAVAPPPTTVGRPDQGSAALRLLDERFARGEIDREEYLSRRGTLLGQREPSRPT